MQIEVRVFKAGSWQVKESELSDAGAVQIVFMFGDTDVIDGAARYEEVRGFYPNAHIVGASTSGNILGAEVVAEPVVATAVRFEKSQVAVASADFREGDDLAVLSGDLVARLPQEGLRHIFVMSDGLLINGSELVRGINRISRGVPVSGGLAGDGARFGRTLVIADDVPASRRIVLVGFYGEALRISCGSQAGWSEFGARRTVTRSEGNVLYEIDGEPALELYKRYLGPQAAELPGSGLRYPLSLKERENDPEVIRTLLSIDEATQSIVFAGDVPEGATVRLMKPDIDVLIEGAGKAAEAIETAGTSRALALVVSCVGRRIVMHQFIDEELEAVQEILGGNVHLCGFYSYGEIAPTHNEILSCTLHNQTMTLTALYEV